MEPDNDRSVAGKSSSKENIPPSNHQNVFVEKKHPDEEYIMDYMKTMYKTHGENLLNKFRSGEPIRIALGQVDESDKARAELLREAATDAISKMNIETDSDHIGMSNGA